MKGRMKLRSMAVKLFRNMAFRIRLRLFHNDFGAGHERRPKDIICTRAHKINVRDGQILPYKKWEYETQNREKPSHALMATGVGGVLYPPR